MAPVDSKNFILFKWLCWHFIETPSAISRAWGNFLVFNLEYFSVAGLLKSLFGHWKGDKVSYGKGLNLKVWANAFIANIISRILGFVARTLVIVFGLIVEVLILAIGLIILLLWLFLPGIVIAGFFYFLGVVT